MLSAVLMTSFMHVHACLDDDDLEGDEDSEDDDAGDDDTGDDDTGPFTLTVTQGYGSGSYAAGAEVHVWAAHAPATQLVTAWSGDTELLLDPGEWHTSMTMPQRDIELHAEIGELDVALTVEPLDGRDRPKTVRHHIPPQPVGIVLFAHGTSGSGEFIEKIEPFYLARVLIDAGFGVWATDAEETDDGEEDARWDASLDPDNVDLANVELILAQFVERGWIEENTPRFVVGMSNGGSFALTAGAALGLDAVVSYCASGRTASAEITTAPTAWFLCEYDHTADNESAQANHQLLLDRGVPTELHIHGPSPLHDARFERIPGIDGPTSAAIASELRALHANPDGYLADDVDTIADAVAANPASYPTLSGLAGTDQKLVGNQVMILVADHQMYDDYARRTLAFLEPFR